MSILTVPPPPEVPPVKSLNSPALTPKNIINKIKHKAKIPIQ